MASAHPRTAARRRALDVLFAADVMNEPAADVLRREKRIDKVTRAIVEGVAANAAEIDELIGKYAEHWAIERMPAVDRNVLRIGVYELLHEPGIPVGAVVNDAVEVAKLLSTEDSGRFVNGLLGRAARTARP